MPELRVYRLPWGDFPDVIVQTTIAKLKAHPDYPNAKAGNPESGIRVVSDLLKPGKVTFKIDAIVPVLQFDANNRNSIPISYAALLAAELKVPVSANRPGARIARSGEADRHVRAGFIAYGVQLSQRTQNPSRGTFFRYIVGP